MIGRAPSAAGHAKVRSLLLVGVWTLAATVMLAVHGGAIWAARDWHPIEPPPRGEPQTPIEIDLPPPPEPSPPQPPQEALPEVQPEQAQVAPTETVQTDTETVQAEPTPAPPEEVQPVTPSEPESVPPEEVQAQPSPEPEVIPETPEVQQAEVVMPPAPKPEKKRERKPPPPRRQPQPQKVEQPRQQQQPQRQQAAVASPPRGQVSGSELAAWKSAVYGRIKRATAGRGGVLRATVSVAMSISSSGAITSISTSSSNPEAAAKAKSLLQGVGSVPPPPGGIGRSIATSLLFQ